MGEVMKIRDANGRFVPGQSGNPQGRPSLDPEVRAILTAAAPHAAMRLVELIGSVDERVATVASQAVLDRLYGKPATNTDLKVSTSSADMHLEALQQLLNKRFADAVPTGSE